jgi:hypothetical protein
MKLAVERTGLQLHCFFKLVSVGLKNCRIAELKDWK